MHRSLVVSTLFRLIRRPSRRTSGGRRSREGLPPLPLCSHCFNMATTTLEYWPENYVAASPAHGLPGRSFEYSSPLSSPEVFTLSLPIPPPRTRALHANYVWSSSIMLADRIATGEIDVEGKRVVELGCGLGLPGIVAAQMGAERVRKVLHTLRRCGRLTHRLPRSCSPTTTIRRCLRTRLEPSSKHYRRTFNSECESLGIPGAQASIPYSSASQSPRPFPPGFAHTPLS